MMWYKDFTLKAVVRGFDVVERQLDFLGATLIGQDHQTDTYFEVDQGKLKYRKGTIEHLITHYERKMEAGLERTVVYRYDVDPAAELVDELMRTKRQVGVTKKTRKIFRWRNVKLHLDELADGMQYVEIEAIDRDNVFTDESLRAQCFEMKVFLGIPDQALVKTGYLNQAEK